jgi:Flp pilus assembly protein TadD
VYWGLGRLLARQGRYSEAVDHMQAVVERAPGDAVAHLFLGRLYLRLEEPTRAETHLAVHAQLEREQRLVATARAQAQEIVRQILGDQAPELE